MFEIKKMERRKRIIRIEFEHESDCSELFWEMVKRGKTPKSEIVADDYIREELFNEKIN